MRQLRFLIAFQRGGNMIVPPPYQKSGLYFGRNDKFIHTGCNKEQADCGLIMDPVYKFNQIGALNSRVRQTVAVRDQVSDLYVSPKFSATLIILGLKSPIQSSSYSQSVWGCTTNLVIDHKASTPVPGTGAQ
jgi:hypothetical protein